MCKGVITIAALALSCGFAFGNSISNLSQIVGRDITQEVCLAMPVGHDFASWETTALAARQSSGVASAELDRQACGTL